MLESKSNTTVVVIVVVAAAVVVIFVFWFEIDYHSLEAEVQQLINRPRLRIKQVFGRTWSFSTFDFLTGLNSMDKSDQNKPEALYSIPECFEPYYPPVSNASFR